jgi:hypothetical protein
MNGHLDVSDFQTILDIVQIESYFIDSVIYDGTYLSESPAM